MTTTAQDRALADEMLARIQEGDSAELAKLLARYREVIISCMFARLKRESELEARPLEEWHEDFGPVLWCKFPIEEAPWVGTPLDSDWPDYHTHWTPLPPATTEPRRCARARGHDEGGGR